MNFLRSLRYGSRFAILSLLLLGRGTAESLPPQVSAPPEATAQLGGNKAELTLTLRFINPSGIEAPVRVQVELLNPEDEIRASITSEMNLEPNQKQLVVKLPRPFDKISTGEMNELHWLRVRYEVRTRNGDILASGIEPLRDPGIEPFILTAAAGRVAAEGRWYQVPVHAKTTEGRSLAGIHIQGKLTWDTENGEKKLTTTTITNSAGNGALQFLVPDAVQADSGDLDIEAQRGLVARSLTHDVLFRSESTLLLDTDKEIYQPGQTLHARILLFDSKRQAVVNETLDVRATDEEETLVSRQTLVTDGFGVAHLDWAIPANVLLGNYRIQVRAGTGDDERRGGDTKSVHIYRYDLPNFRVVAKPDQRYYLPKQSAEVSVSAEYLFGKPVTRGKVRVVEEKERNWNFRKQEWETKEGQVQSGDLDRDGRFTARFDLEQSHKDLAGQSHDSNFRDLSLAAYVTDLTTGHTEQRRFSLRVTRDPIHVYAVAAGASSGNLPPSYYISTFYADGAPARCKVRLSSLDEDDAPSKKHPLRAVETNQYGLAKVTGLLIPEDGGDSLLAEASDLKGLTGSHIERIYREDVGVLEVTTAHAIHKKDDPIEVTLRGTKSNLRVVVEAGRDGAVLARQEVRLRNGRAYLVFPYDQRFSDEINITAYALEEVTSPYSYLEGSVTVLYPKNRRLGLTVQFDKDEHRPGEDATARFSVRRPDHTGAESALGVKMVDSAVEARTRTDSDFGQRSASSWWRWSLWSAEGNSGFGGISREDLDQIDMDEPVPQDLDLVAEYILRSGSRDTELLAGEPGRPVEEVFSKKVSKQFEPLEKRLGEWNEQDKLPRNEAELAVLANENGLDLRSLRDPWGTPYRYELGFKGADHFLKVNSAGPDKQFGGRDDFTAQDMRRKFFLYYGSLLEKAVRELMDKKGHFIRDRGALDAELLKKGVDFEALRDPWGEPYEARFLVSGSYYLTQVVSHGEDFAAKKKGVGTIVWEDRVDYFETARRHIDRVLTAHLHAGGAYPNNEDQFKTILREAGVDLGQLRDPWGSPYYVVFKDAAQYGDQVTIQQSQASGKRLGVPVTLIRKEVRLMSAGMDQHPGTNDDFQVSAYSVLVSEQSAKDNQPVPPPIKISLSENTAAITGTVEDPSGAVIANATVEATREGTEEKSSMHTDGNGKFELKDLKPGTYQLVCSAQGFRSLMVTAVPVQAGTVTEVSFELSVGQASSVVEVASTSAAVFTQSSNLATVNVRSLPLTKLSPGVSSGVAAGMVLSTPRLRQDFPETMLWEPAVVTDRRGRARLNFKLADNITTWKLTAFASTRNGELGRAEKDLRAFQAFFIEHDPPRILTQGDEIDYPVVLRNYLDHVQTLKAWIKPEAWFTTIGPAELPVKVDAGDAARAVFRYRAVTAVTAGKQQVGAANAEISDAAQKPVDVHPFGRPTSETASSVMQRKGVLTLQVPKDTIAESIRARVKVYPNLLAHVVENLEAGLERPHGCGEQTVSSTYPSLLVMEIYAKSAKKPAVALKAQRYLEAGYERLLRYQDFSGGFTYWGHGNPDLALTAYALEFLHHAGRFMEIDVHVTGKAEKWILGQQGKDGSWRGRGDRNDKDAILQTAYIAQMLSVIAESGEPAPDLRAGQERALAFLAAHHDLIDEPYIIASYALTTKAAGHEKTFAELLGWLRMNVHHENNAAYWELERNTPFYGWGTTGRLESTALALRALASSPDANGSDQELIRQGLLFLLRSEDKDGMWYSGQTTVHVLKTLLSMVGMRVQESGAKLSVRVNDQDAATIDLPQGQTATAPIEVDVTKLVKTGENRVDLATSSDGIISVQFVAESYVAWQDDAATTVKAEPNASSMLKFAVTYSATKATTDDKVECNVRAERLGYHGHGMMLGEAGLPPGAEVDRESLERALKGSNSVFRYDVLPDRVILYLWPSAGGSDFTFQFRPRFAMRAETAPSLLYDYYNPEASVTVKPSHFQVTQGKEQQASAR